MNETDTVTLTLEQLEKITALVGKFVYCDILRAGGGVILEGHKSLESGDICNLIHKVGVNLAIEILTIATDHDSTKVELKLLGHRYLRGFASQMRLESM